MICAACKGVVHPATGHQHSAHTLICGPCARQFFRWLQGHTRPRGRGPSFYDAAVKWKQAS